MSIVEVIDRREWEIDSRDGSFECIWSGKYEYE